MTVIDDDEVAAVRRVRRTLAASGIAVDDEEAQAVLAFRRKVDVAELYRRLPIGDLEPRTSFDPRWHA